MNNSKVFIPDWVPYTSTQEKVALASLDRSAACGAEDNCVFCLETIFEAVLYFTFHTANKECKGQ